MPTVPRCPKGFRRLDKKCVKSVHCPSRSYRVASKNICFPEKYKKASKFDVLKDIDNKRLMVIKVAKELMKIMMAENKMLRSKCVKNEKTKAKGKKKASSEPPKATYTSEDVQRKFNKKIDDLSKKVFSESTLKQIEEMERIHKNLSRSSSAPSSSKPKTKKRAVLSTTSFA
ncbi:MAG: hypothetical protein V4708_06365 [Bacteroidota bacterium]